MWGGAVLTAFLFSLLDSGSKADKERKDKNQFPVRAGAQWRQQTGFISYKNVAADVLCLTQKDKVPSILCLSKSNSQDPSF